MIEASTKSGKTTGCCVWLLEQAMGGTPGQQFWWVAPVYMQAEIAYRLMKFGIPRSVYHANDSRLTIDLPNETTIWFKSAEKPDNLYGEGVHAAVLDEATRMREEAWHAIRSTLTATRGPVRIIGNVKGRKNWAYRLARRAEAGEPEWSYAKITAYDAVQAGVLAKDEIEDARRSLPESVFRELYLAEPSDDEGNPFGIQAIQACIGPVSEEQPEVWGWDLARSIDWTVGIALDRTGAVCRFSRWQSPWEETHRRILDETGRTWAFVDCTGTGDAPFERLQRSGGDHFQGYLFSAPSKQHLMEGLAVAIQHKEIRFPDGPITSELEAFEYVYSRTGVRYSAPDGLHDDCVCALALAVACLGSTNREPFRLLNPSAEERRDTILADLMKRDGVYWP